MQELNLTAEQAITLLAVLVPLIVYLWTHLGTYQLHIEPERKSEGKHTRPIQNERYGAYVWLAGKRFN